MKQSRSRAHLTLASENSSARISSREVIGIDALSEQQNNVAKHLVSRANCSGVIVGALVGEESWETRPLLLISGKLFILRFSDPSSSLNRNKMNYIRSLYAQLGAHKELGRSAFAVGQSDGQIWTLRRFHQSTFANLNIKETNSGSQHPVHRAQKLIELVASMQTAGIVHGHLSLTNVGADEEIPMVLDFGFGALEASGKELAPEVRNGFPPSLASDIYGLGKILESLLKSENLPEIQNIIKLMLSDEPASRPNIDLIKKTFLVKKNTEKSSAPIKNPMSSGKVLGKASKQTPTVTESISGQTNLNGVNEPPPLPHDQRSSDSISKERKPTEIIKLSPPEETGNKTLAEDTEVIEQSASEPTAKATRARNFTTLIKPTSPTPTVVNNLTATIVPTASPARLKARAQMSEENYLPDTTETTHTVARSNNLIVVFCLMIFLAIGTFAVTFAVKQSKKINQPIDLEAFWQSGQTKLQSQVILAAIKNNSSEASKIILSSVDKNEKIENVRSNLLKIGFSKLWSDAYSDSDRKILLGLSLEKPPAEVLESLPNINSAHSGVILAIASQMGENKETKIGELPISVYSDLSEPFNTAFAALEIFGIKQIGEPEALGLARIITGNVSPASLKLFLQDQVSGKIGVLKILTDALGEKFALSLIDANEPLAKAGMTELSWFAQSKNVPWQKISATNKIDLASGLSELSELSIDHKLDLLSFPITEIREATTQKLKTQLDENITPVLELLPSSNNKLSREQKITLISTLSYQGEHSKKFTLEWFKTNPDPEAVLDILLARNKKELTDFFNLQSAHYLAGKKWNAELSKLKQLAVHHEQVARALAYARLDPSNKEQLSFLRKMSNIEPVNSIRRGILHKLKPYESRSSVVVKTIEE
jgi:hypothetical protein